MNIEAVCDRSYHASRSSGVRDTRIIKWVVLHSEEASTARSAATWFAITEPPPPKGNGPAGSAHLCVDDTICYRTLRNEEIPWAAPGANVYGFHIEQAGFARWAAGTWLLHRDTLRRAAYKTAVHLIAFDLPPVFLRADALKAGKKGVTTHAECTKAFGGDHTDPGLFWPRRYFMRLVNAYYGDLLV